MQLLRVNVNPPDEVKWINPAAIAYIGTWRISPQRERLALIVFSGDTENLMTHEDPADLAERWEWAINYHERD